MKTIKIIDLLNMRARGEKLPQRIKVFDIEFIFDKEEKTYISNPCYEHEYLFSDYAWEENLNTEVEIIEDTPKKIEECECITSQIPPWFNGEKLIKVINENFDKHDEVLRKIIDYINGEHNE